MGFRSLLRPCRGSRSRLSNACMPTDDSIPHPLGPTRRSRRVVEDLAVLDDGPLESLDIQRNGSHGGEDHHRLTRTSVRATRG